MGKDLYQRLNDSYMFLHQTMNSLHFYNLLEPFYTDLPALIPLDNFHLHLDTFPVRSREAQYTSYHSTTVQPNILQMAVSDRIHTFRL